MFALYFAWAYISFKTGGGGLINKARVACRKI